MRQEQEKERKEEEARKLKAEQERLEKERKDRPVLKVSVRLYCWVEHVKTGNQSEKKFQAREATIKHWIMLRVS